MSVVYNIPFNRKDRETIQPDSLLEKLYTNFPLTQLETMLTERPDDKTLLAWNVNVRDYRAIVRRAIELIRED